MSERKMHNLMVITRGSRREHLLGIGLSLEERLGFLVMEEVPVQKS